MFTHTSSTHRLTTDTRTHQGGVIAGIGRLPFFSGSLLILIALRSLVDRLELGAFVAAAMLGLATLAVLHSQALPRRTMAFLLTLSLLIGWGYANAVHIHGQPLFSLRGVIRYATYIAVLVTAYLYRPRLSHLFGVYTFVVAAQIALTLFQKFVLGFEQRPPGSLINSNHVSYLLVPYFSLALFYFRAYFRAALAMVFSLYLGGLGGFLALLVISIGFVFTRGTAALKLGSVLLAPLFLAIALGVLSERIQEQSDIIDVQSRMEEDRAGGGGSLVWRLVTWKAMLGELREKQSELTGQGLEYASMASPYFLSASPLEPHNDYLRVWLELGLFGLILYILVYWWAAVQLIKSSRHFFAGLGAPLGWTLVSLGIAQLVGNIITQSTLWWFFFAFAGIHFARLRQLLRQPN